MSMADMYDYDVDSDDFERMRKTSHAGLLEKCLEELEDLEELEELDNEYGDK